MPTLSEIEWIPVESSNIAAIAHGEKFRVEDSDEEVMIVFVKFKSGEAAVWEYLNVPVKTWEAFQKAESKGSFFAKHIKGKFTSNRIMA